MFQKGPACCGVYDAPLDSVVAWGRKGRSRTGRRPGREWKWRKVCFQFLPIGDGCPWLRRLHFFYANMF